jgi:PAS domain-containing protein
VQNVSVIPFVAGKNLHAMIVIEDVTDLVHQVQAFREMKNVAENELQERKKAEDALRESEERYSGFFRTSGECVFITSKDGHWIDLNDAAVDLFGYKSREELMQVRVPDLYADPEDRKRHIRAVEEQGSRVRSGILPTGSRRKTR